MADDPAAQIRARALAEGFDAVGFAPATLGPEARARLTRFVEAGHHGDMGWLTERTEQRSHPQSLWPQARSVIVLGLNYGPDYDPLAVLEDRTGGVISAYAQGRDYHDVVKKKLRVVARWMAERFAVEVKLFVDTAPVMEKPLSQSAGLGWQGRHTNLVSREFGSWLFLGEIYTTLELAPDPAEVDHCGGCRACLDICPTSAFPAPYQLDARRCISSTIEHKGPIARELRPLIGNRIYGCDDCLAVCPWNKFARPTGIAEFRGSGQTDRLRELALLDDAAFRLRFSGSPVKRIGRDRFIRNVLIAVGNSADPALEACAESLLRDPSPLVRGAAIWALSRLVPARLAALRAQDASGESDPAVLLEWQECADDAAQNRSVC